MLWSYCYVKALRFDSERGFSNVYGVFSHWSVFKMFGLHMGPFLHSLTWWDGSVSGCWGWEGSQRSVCAAPRRSSQRGRWASPPDSDVRQTGQENKACDLRELSDRYRYSWQRGCETIAWPSPRWLARSQHHLWLGVHLFCIRVPPLELQLAVESQLSENDIEFEDTFWKNSLLMQLRFPCVTDRNCVTEREWPTNYFFHWSSRIC